MGPDARGAGLSSTGLSAAQLRERASPNGILALTGTASAVDAGAAGGSHPVAAVYGGAGTAVAVVRRRAAEGQPALTEARPLHLQSRCLSLSLAGAAGALAPRCLKT